MTKPPIMSTNKPLPFGDLSPLEFERMCLWLVDREGYLCPQHLGEAGSEQGRDVVAYKPTDAGEELWYFQCKRYKRINAATLKKEVDKYNKLAESDPTCRPTGIVFVTNAVVSAGVRDEVADYCQRHGYSYDFWAHTELDMRVKKHPDVVQEFFDASSELLERLVQEVRQHLEAMSPSPTKATGITLRRPKAEVTTELQSQIERGEILLNELSKSPPSSQQELDEWSRYWHDWRRYSEQTMGQSFSSPEPLQWLKGLVPRHLDFKQSWEIRAKNLSRDIEGELALLKNLLVRLDNY